MNDIFKALFDWVSAQTAITDLVGSRIYVNRLPKSVIETENTFRPSTMLVIRQAGGAGKASQQEFDTPNFNVLCYGEDDLEADRVRRAVWQAFLFVDRVNQGGVLLHHVNATGGPVPSRDPDIVWPVVSQSYNILAATEAIA